MKILNLSACAPLFLASALPALAQQTEDTEKIPPPKPPFIARVTPPAAWTITFTRPAADEMVDLDSLKKFAESSMGVDSPLLKSLNEIKDPVAKAMVRTLRVTRTRDFVKESSKFSDGTEETTYVFNDKRITKHSDYDGLIRSRRDQSNAGTSPDFSAADFSGFEWLKPENYKGTQKVEKRTCYFFTDETETEEAKMIQAAGLSAGKAPMMTVRAFIDVNTKLPVVLQRGEETRIYTFGKPDSADLVLPQEVAKDAAEWNAELLRATRAAPPP